MVTGTMIGVAYVYLSVSLVIVGHLPMLCLNGAYLLSCWSGVGRLVLFTYSALKHNSLEWHLTIASLCMLGADGPWGSVVLLYSLHTNTSEQM